MRPARSLREFSPSAKEPVTSAPTPVGAPTPLCTVNASPELANQIAQARRDARLHPAQAALLLRVWMSGND